ncbi:hypothetical protein CKK68_004639 [Escherichia coli]|nr:hypothetical protein [Escherichia coli]
MSNKIENPVVLIHKRENHDSYAVAITNGSHDFYDGLLMASVSPDEADNSFAVFAMVGYYMAAEIEKLLAQRDALAAENAALKESERAFDAMCAEEHGDNWVSELTETPATDAFWLKYVRRAWIAGLIHLGIRYADVEVMKIAGDAQLSTPCTDSIINSIAAGIFTKEGAAR